MKFKISVLLWWTVSTSVTVKDSPRTITNKHLRIRTASTVVSLVGGRWEWEGRVEISGSDGTSGSMCADSLTEEDRNVICRSLFHHRQNIFGWPVNSTAYGGDLESNVLNVTLLCNGDEDDVTGCPGFDLIWTDRSECRNGEAAIRCTSDTGVELIHPKHAPENAGRPEIFISKTWGTFCSNGFDNKDAAMICSFNGYWTSYGKVTSGSNYGNTTAPSLVENFHCDGNEPDVEFCTWDRSTCSRDQDVGIECEERFLNESEIKLTGSGQPWIGRVELRLDNRNITASCCGGDLWFSVNDADVICRTLNYRYGGKLRTPMPVSQTAPGLLEQLYCHGNEQNIGQCAARWASDSYDCPTYPPLVAAVDCSGSVGVKVTAGVLPFEGTIEMQVKGHWYIVDSKSVHQNEAKAICSTMGYQDTTPHIFPADTFRAPNHAHISIRCGDDAIHIAQCDIDTRPVNHAKHASIHCFDCGNQIYYRENGVVTSDHYPSAVSHNVDCMYHIKSKGLLPKYRLYFDDLHLGHGDVVTIRENPMQSIVATYTNRQGPSEVLFTNDLYIRFKAHSGAKFRFKWEPATISSQQLEKAISVQCTGTDMKASVDLAKLRAASIDTDPSYLSLSDVTCVGVTDGNIWTVNATHSSCKTQRMIQPDYIIYKNTVSYRIPGNNPGDATVRWSVDIDCAFARNTSAQTDISITENSKDILQVNQTTQYSASLNLFTDAALQHEVKGPSARVQLGTDLYARVTFWSKVNVRLRLQSCSLKENMTVTPAYPIIQDGCAIDKDTSIISQNDTQTVFHFKAVEFVAGVTSAFLNCDVTYCLPDDSNQACNQQCTSRRHDQRRTEPQSIRFNSVTRLIEIL